MPAAAVALGSSVPVDMIILYPGLDHFDERGRTPGHQRHHLPEAGPFHLAGLAPAILMMGRAVQVGQDLEVGLVLAGGIAFGVAGAGLGQSQRGISSKLIWISLYLDSHRALLHQTLLPVAFSMRS